MLMYIIGFIVLQAVYTFCRPYLFFYRALRALVTLRGTEKGVYKALLYGFIPNSKHRFTTSFLQALPYLVTPLGPENCQLTSSFFVGAQTVVSLLQTTQIISDVCFITDHVAYAKIV